MIEGHTEQPNSAIKKHLKAIEISCSMTKSRSFRSFARRLIWFEDQAWLFCPVIWHFSHCNSSNRTLNTLSSQIIISALPTVKLENVSSQSWKQHDLFNILWSSTNVHIVHSMMLSNSFATACQGVVKHRDRERERRIERGKEQIYIIARVPVSMP